MSEPRCQRDVTRHPSSVLVFLILLVLVGTPTCNRPDRSPGHVPRSSASAAETESAQQLAIGAVLRTSITGDEPLICAHVERDSRTEGPCQRFRLRTPAAGVLVIHLAWDDHHPLGLRLRTHEGKRESTSCCHSPLELKGAVDAGGVYEIDVILLTDWGVADRQSFELTATVERAAD
jgi:hypothetical protein